MTKSNQTKPRKSLLAKMATELTEQEIAAISGAHGCPSSFPSHSFVPDGPYCANDN